MMASSNPDGSPLFTQPVAAHVEGRSEKRIASSFASSALSALSNSGSNVSNAQPANSPRSRSDSSRMRYLSLVKLFKNNMEKNPISHQEIIETSSDSKKCCSGNTARSKQVLRRMRAIHISWAWHLLVLLASLIMIFGEALAYYVPLTHIQVSLVIFVLTYLLIVVDVVLYAMVDPDYFSWYCRCCRNSSFGNKENTCCFLNSPTSTEEYRSRKRPIWCSMGSFYFWMDLIALTAYAFDFASTFMTNDIKLTMNGSVLVESKSSGSNRFIVALILIGKSAIFARLFRASTIVDYMNWMDALKRKVTRQRDGFRKSHQRRTFKDLSYTSQSKLLKDTSATKIQNKWRSTRASRRNKPRNLRNISSISRDSSERTFVHQSVRERAQSSRVGSKMRELTARHVAVLVIASLIISLVVSFDLGSDKTMQRTMISLSIQTQNSIFSSTALDVARNTSVPFLYQYFFANGTVVTFPSSIYDVNTLKERDFITYTVNSSQTGITSAIFIMKEYNQHRAATWLTLNAFIIIIWLWGVVGLVGPVMTLVVVPIERAIRLISMLTKDPLGYQKSEDYKRFVEEEDDVTRGSHWEKEVLQGMETTFLQTTMLRIGSLMSVGFGTAGVEIIRQYLLKDSSTGRLALNQSGITVNCIFLFCDIRQFTDATEALQEEVFVFTNKIAFVVHSISHAYGGSANKNIGDAFLVTWKLPDDPSDEIEEDPYAPNADSCSQQADMALYSVIKIRLALYNDSYFLKELGAAAKGRLLEKLGDGKGPVVRMGCGLHAGKAVQGAIGSQRKIDPTYISEHVERAETLESLTKRYGLGVLMSDSFYNILSPDVSRRCRKVDRVLLSSDEADDYCFDDASDTMGLYTFDMDVLALQQKQSDRGKKARRQSSLHSSRASKRMSIFSSSIKANTNIAEYLESLGTNQSDVPSSAEENSTTAREAAGTEQASGGGALDSIGLRLPPYSVGVWKSEEIRVMRMGFTDGFFYPTFASALESYFNGDWEDAKIKFTLILDRMSDGPSSYFLGIIEANGGRPFPGFNGYGDI